VDFAMGAFSVDDTLSELPDCSVGREVFFREGVDEISIWTGVDVFLHSGVDGRIAVNSNAPCTPIETAIAHPLRFLFEIVMSDSFYTLKHAMDGNIPPGGQMNRYCHPT
jgi:hypothetical protein